jgi:CRP-like cAMP-binding protein
MASDYGMPKPVGAVAMDTLHTRRHAGDWVPVLQGVPLFADLNSRHLKRVAALGSLRRVTAHTRIVKKDDRGDAFYVILDGSAIVEPMGITLDRGSYFGELALIDDSPRSADVTALEESLLLQIPRSKFTKLLKDEPAIALGMLKELARRLRAAR